MPLYDYRCSACGHERIDEFEKITSEPQTVCPSCGKATFARVPQVVGNNLREFHTPIEMYSIGLNSDEEIREFRAKCPDVDVCTDSSSDLYGVPIARNRAQKLAALKAAGFEER